MNFFKKIGILLLFLIVFGQCRKQTGASWDVDLVLPVVTSQLNIKNFLGDSVFKTDNTGLLDLSVTRTITAIKLDSLIKLPDTNIVKLFPVPPGFYAPGQSFTFIPPDNITFNIPNGVALKTADIRTGLLTVKFTNDLDGPIDIIYNIPSATKYGLPLVISEIVPGATTVAPVASGTLVKTYDLAGYNLNLTGLNGTTYNSIVEAYTISVDPSNTLGLSPALGKFAKIEITYAKVIPQYVEGYFGQQSVAVPFDTTKLDLIKNFQASNFMLSSATCNFNILNEFGCEFSANLSNIKSINSPTIIPLNTTQLSNMNINSASKVGATIFPSVKTISLTNINSNIVPFLSNLPNKLTFQGNINVNPNGNLSGYHDFAFYNTGIKVLADINIPFKFTANYFKLISNTKVDFANVTSLDKVNGGKFIISANNGYPFATKIQAYLLDENNVKIDSLFTTGANTIAGGILDNQNVVIAQTASSIEMPIDAAKIQNLKKSKSIRIETSLIMPTNPPPIKIYEKYTIDVNIVAELNVRAERK